MDYRRFGWVFLAASALVSGCVAGEPTDVDTDLGEDDAEEQAAYNDTLRQRVGETIAYNLTSAFPHVSGETHTVKSQGAEFVRVHFQDFHLAKGAQVRVYSPDGEESFTYENDGPNKDGDFWSFAITGDTAIIEVVGEGKNKNHGFAVTEVGHGTVKLADPTLQKKNASDPSLEVVCSTDGREDIACYPSLSALAAPVARLLFVSGASQYLCTGWLVAGSNSSTMLTNNHCFSTQNEVNTVQAYFGYQNTTCGGGTIATQAIHNGGTFLKTNTVNRKGTKGGLDYTLFTLQGNPEATFGEIVATTKASVVGDLIYFIQHPGGQPKKIGYWEDANHATRCDVDTINQTYGQAKAGSQTGYACDSEGGSSGSPILDANTGRAVALHHYGGVTSSPCLNSGTAMSHVCADAGSLLSCVNN